MTQTLTTERLKQLAGFKGAPAWGEEERSMAAELLRYREAAETPSCWEIAGQLFTTKEEALKPGYRGAPEPLYDVPVLTDDREAQPVASREHFESLCNQFWNWDEFDEINAEEEPRLQWDGKNYTHRVTAALWRMYQAAPPAPAATTTISFSENSDADMCREWAWKQVKELLTPDGWTVGDNITYFGFFCWGWDMRRQYNEQRPPAPAVPEIDELRLAFERAERESDDGFNLHKYGIGYADEVTQVRWESWLACRAAMLKTNS